jgi:uncharacterized protein YhaN
MRLDRLDLARYGKFTDRSLDFGAPRPGKPDFHLVHGPNEAGKSTLFSAYLDLVFGIEKSSAYGFLHPYPLMRVGGVLTVGTERHEAYRLKRNQNSLVAPDDRPLSETIFSAALGGTDRNAYRTMFSLDDESIEKGGEDILKSEGELGAMLFSASSGLSDMASGLLVLKAEADEFYRPSGRKHGLAALKTEIDALRDERKTLDVAARDYGALVRERDAAAERYATAYKARNEHRAALADIERRLDALPKLARLRSLREQMGGFELGDTPPPGWRAVTVELGREEAEISARTTRIAADRERWADELAALEEDPAVLAVEQDLAALAGSALEARFRTAGMDLASREAERDRLRADIAARLAALGLPPDTDPHTVRLPAGLADRLTAQFSRRSGVVERADAARRELAEAEKAMAAARADAEAAAGAPGDDALQSSLSTAIRAIRAADLSGRMREAHRLAALARQAAEESLRRLGGSRTDAETLEKMQVPTESRLADLRARLETATETARRKRAEAEDAARDLKLRQANLDAVLSTSGLIGEGEAEVLRRARDAAWQAHRAALDADTAGLFEQAMQADDRAVDARLKNADRLSEIRLLERTIAEAAARLALVEGEAHRAEAARVAVTDEVAALAARLDLGPADLADVEGFLEARADALAAAAASRRQEAENAAVSAEAVEAKNRLGRLLGLDFAQDVPLEEALVAAEDRLAALRETQSCADAARQSVAAAEQQLAARRAAAAETGAALVAWQAAWDDTVAGTFLATPEASEGMERIDGLLSSLQTLSQRIEQHDEYDHRITGMRRDQQDYARFVGDLAERLRMPFDAASPQTAMAELVERLEAARTVRLRSREIEAALARLQEDEAVVLERRVVLDVRTGEILSFLGCDTLAEADGLLEAHRRREDLRDRITDAERDLVAQMRCETVDEAEALLSAVDDVQLAAERDDLVARLDALDRNVEEQHAARARAEEALSCVAGGDEAAVLEERRRTALVELAEKSRRYLATRAGILAAEQALRLYRERHRSVMMERASRTFREITGGEYAGLSTVLEKDGEYLVANAASGASKLAKDLSKGTRFQLYLALRVAGYHEIAASREIVPFIADDIMETFDDRRALNALRVLGTMAMGGQVLYLTHHQHLRDLALQACPDVTIHEL